MNGVLSAAKRASGGSPADKSASGGLFGKSPCQVVPSTRRSTLMLNLDKDSTRGAAGALLSGEAAARRSERDRRDFLAVEVGDPANASPGGPSPEHRFARGVVSVARRDEPVFEHWLALIGGGELKAEIWIACGHLAWIAARPFDPVNDFSLDTPFRARSVS
jgi:hypothetical protein